MGYLNEYLNPQKTPQSEPARDDQVENNAGGYVFAIDKWELLRRFLILGTEGGTYYVKPRKLTSENLDAVKACLAEDGGRVVYELVEISVNGRAHKNDQALLVLAMAACDKNEAVRKLAWNSLSQVARIGTHLFQFMDFYTSLGGGWGRSKTRALQEWYLGKPVDALAYQLCKYQERQGWSHRDVLKLAHPKPIRGSDRDAAFRWPLRNHGIEQLPNLPRQLAAVNQLHKTQNIAEAAGLIREENLPREVVPSELLTSPEIWDALLGHMPMTATIRNLGTMSKVGLLTPLSSASAAVCERLTNAKHIRKSRVHPIQILAAMITYGQGHGSRGHGEWDVVPAVLEALDVAFYHAFDNVEPTGKRILIGLDVSGSMSMESARIASIPGLYCRTAAAAMAMVTMRTEPLGNWHVTAFSDGLIPLDIGPRMRLDDVVDKISGLDFSSTDCALPMLYAMQKKLPVDAFIIYTDNETWCGRVHPFEALRQYRKQTGIPAKLIVVGMVSTGFSIADPADPGMLDVVGFDTATPNIISEFIK